MLTKPTTLLTLSIAALAAGPMTGWAKEFPIPHRIVLGVDTGYTGYAVLPSFTLTDNYYPTDTLSIQVSGTVDMNSSRHTVNAAGVIVAPARPDNLRTTPRSGLLHLDESYVDSDSLGRVIDRE